MYVTLKQKGMALLSYFLILVLIPLLTHREDRFVHYHAKQGLMMMLLWIGFLVISLPLTYIPSAGIIIIAIIFAILMILELVCLLMVLLGKTWCLPVLGVYAEEWNI